MDPPHLNGRSRYDHLPPPPSHFLDPNYYLHHTHHHDHHHPRFPPPPPPPPVANHHQHHCNDHDRRFPEDRRLYFPYLHPPDPPLFDPLPLPPPPPRVHDRVLLPEGHPSPRPHLSGGGEPFRRDFWDGRGVNVDKFRVFDQRPNPIRSEWEQEARLGPIPAYRAHPYLPADSSDALAGRKRLRWDQDRDLEEEDSFPHHHHHHPRDFVFEQAPPDASFAAVSRSSPRGSRFGLVSNRGRGGERDASSLSEQRLPLPSLLPASHSYSDVELFDKNSTMDSRTPAMGTDHVYRENHYVDNRGKRRLCGGYTQDLARTPSRQKPSALSRIQSGISVWDRIEEKPDFVASPSPPPPPPPPTLPPQNFSEEQQQGIDGLDLSYKSNALVAKVMVPPRSVMPTTNRKGSASETPNKKVIKKKVVKKRMKVVVPNIPIVTVGSELMDGIPTKPITSSHHKVSVHSASQEAIVSSAKPASDDTLTLAECGTTDNARDEGKTALRDEESRKCGNAIVSEIRCSNDTSSQLCQYGFTVITSCEKSAAKQSTRAENSVKARNIKDIREEECMTPGEKAVQNSSNPMVSDMGIPHDTRSQLFTQRANEVMESHGNVAAEGSPKSIVLVEDETADDPHKRVPRIVEDVRNSVHIDKGFSMPSIKGSSISGFWTDAQVVMSAGFATSPCSGDSLKGKSRKKKREGEEKQQRLDVGMTTVGLKILGGKSELGGPSLHPHVSDMSAVLPQEVKNVDLDQTLIDGAIDGEDHGLSFSVRDGTPESDCISLGKDPLVVSLSYSSGERMKQSLPFRHSKVGSLVLMPNVHGVAPLTIADQSYCHLSDVKGCSNDNQDEKSFRVDDPLLTSKKLLASEAGEDVKLDEDMLHHLPIPGKAQLLSSNQPKRQITGALKVAGEEPLSRKTNLSSGIPRVLPNRVNLARSRKEIAHSSQSARNKTWHRNNTPPSASASHVNVQFPGSGSMHKQSPKKLSKLHSSYVRKGNSLIRKSTTEVCPPQQSHVLGVPSRMSRHLTKTRMSVETQVDRTDHAACSNPPVERPKTPPLPLGTKLPHTMSEDLNSEAGVETQVGPLENQIVDFLSGSLDNQSIVYCKKMEPFKTKRMIYVKHKSNQLVAAPRSEIGDSSTRPTERVQTLPSTTPSDLYYKRKKNQLILSAASSDSQQKRDLVISVDNSNSDDQKTSMVPSLTWNTTSLLKKRLDKVLRKAYKHPNFSRVWTLTGEKWHKKSATSLNRWKVLPHLFPWKRTIYGKHSISHNVSTPNRRSLSLISRKLQHMRKRDTIYKVSTDGFSLRKAGVLSIGGSSLKWSKSIERRSKKASEEATLAVAEVQRKKRERKIITSVGSSKKNETRLPRERIFRVGSARYKMDSSKRTLIRISDEQASCVIGQQSGNKNQISFAPRRLLIGNDEYVRIGNGNQLVRDPKKLIRILASEKVRWSLHTARLRLARKQQYCQFFTRFGECNKNGGRCPYIHDLSKVAICTKFLRGLCSNTNCKLTHKVVPERMPDCSYFLKGLCTNTKCPYRHVNVNPSASVCEGFLRGYCADGDECRKKHSYVCPLFQATGKCSQGQKCKLHHPNMANKSKKRKHKLNVQSNGMGRYFGSSIHEVVEPLVVAPDKHDEAEKGGDLFCSDGRFADYISLDVGSDDDDDDVPMGLRPTWWGSDLSHMQPDDLDVLIKPIRIMNKEGGQRFLI